MSVLQEQAVQMIRGLSDDNVSFLIEIIQRLMPSKQYKHADQSMSDKCGMEAFSRLDAARAEIKQYLPENFDPDRELAEARIERYESIG